MPRHDPPSPDARERWKPADYEQYFVVLGNGNIQNIVWHSTPFDHEAWTFGNCFRVRTDAECARDAIKAFLWNFHSEHVQYRASNEA